MVCAELCGAGLAALGAGASAAGTLITPPNGDGSFAMDLQRFAEGSTEVVQRAMSWAEFEATEETGLLRAGRACVNYLSDFVNSDALRARLRLALLQTPEVRVTMEVPSACSLRRLWFSRCTECQAEVWNAWPWAKSP